MYDINELEQKWLRYRRKRIAVYSAFVILAVLAAASLAYYLTYAKSSSLPVSVNKANKSSEAAMGETSDRTKPLSSEVPSVSASRKAKKGFRITFSDAGKKTDVAQEGSPAKKIDIKVTPKKSQLSVKEIESRFADIKDKDDALFLARYYYDKKQYKKALTWALEANKLDSNTEESWLVFAKAKARLGARKEAIRVLQAYYDRSGSQKAKQLLDKIRRGKSF